MNDIDFSEQVKDLSASVGRLVSAMQDRANTAKGYVDFAKIRELQTERPGELDRLEGLVGDWEGPTRVRVLGTDQILEGFGVRHFAWAIDRRYLFNTWKTHMGGGMGQIEALEIWTWDPSISRYRTWWFHSWGVFGTGIVTYNAQTGEFLMEGDERNSLDGKESRINTRVAGIDPNTISWRARDTLGERGYEISGTAHRVKPGEERGREGGEETESGGTVREGAGRRRSR